MAKEITVPLTKEEVITPKFNTDQLVKSMGASLTPEMEKYIRSMKPEDLVKQALAGKSQKEYGKNYDNARTEALHELIKVSGDTWFKIYNEKRALHGLNPVKRS